MSPIRKKIKQQPPPLAPLVIALTALAVLSPAHAQSAPKYTYKAYVKDLLSSGTITPPPPPEALGELTITPSSFNFSATPVGSTAQTILVIKNNASNPAASVSLGQPLLTPTLGLGFQMIPSCPSELGAGASCQVTIQYSPTSPTTASAAFSFPSANAATPLPLASLAGQGTLANLQFSTSTLAFPDTDISTTSAPMAITLTNTGNAALPITSLTTTAPFAITSNSCTSSLAPNSSCSVSLTFSPSLAQDYNQPVTVNSSGTTYSAALSGKGLGPILAASPAQITLVDTQDTSAPVSQAGTSLSAAGFNPITSPPSLPYKKKETTITLTNSGTRALSNLTISGQVASDAVNAAGVPFVSNNCPSSLAPNASCTLTLSRYLHIPYTASGSISVSGTGMPSFSIPLSVKITPPSTNPESLNKVSSDSLSYNFNSLAVGSSATKTVTFTYNGTSTASIHLPAATSTLTPSNDNCSNTTLTPGDSCSVDITLTARTPFTQTVPWNPSYSFGSSATSTTLSHSFGYLGLGELLSMSEINFGSNPSNAAVSTQARIYNNGNRPSSLAITPPSSAWAPAFNLSACPSALQPGTSCLVTASSTAPASEGTYSAPFSLSGSTSTLAQSASISVSNTPILSLSAAALDFGFVSNNNPVASQSISVSNIGGAAASIAALATTAPFDVLVSPAPGSAGTGCSPSAIQPLSTCVLTFSVNTTNLPSSSTTFSDSPAIGLPPYQKTVALLAKTLPASANSLSNIAISPSSLAFPFTPVGLESLPSSVTITNNNPSPFSFTSTLEGPYAASYKSSSTCTSPLPANSSCTITASYTPNGSESGSAPAIIKLVDPPSGAFLGINLTSSSAQVNAIDFSPLNFNSANPQTDKTVKQAYFQNKTASTLHSSPSLQFGSNFTVLNHSCASVAPNAYCTATLQAKTDTQGMFQDFLDINGTTYNLSSSVYPFPDLRLLDGANQVAALNFGTVSHNKPLPTKALLLDNNSPTQADLNPLNLFSLNGVRQSNDCPSALTANNPCHVNIDITPKSTSTPIGVDSYSWASTLLVTTKSGLGNIAIPISGTALVGTWSLPSSIDFGKVYIGQTLSDPSSAAISNTSANGAEITLTAATSDKQALSLDTSACLNQWLPSGQACTIPLSFAPTSTSDNSGTISFSIPGKANQRTSIPWTATIISGFSTEGVLTPSVWDPSGTVGSTIAKTFTLTNTYYLPITVSAPSPIPPKMSLSNNSCTNATLQPNASCSFTLTLNSSSAYEAPAPTTVKLSLGTVNQDVSLSIPSQRVYIADPSITSIVHGSDPSGYGLQSGYATAVTISGSNFSTKTSETMVYVNGVLMTTTASSDSRALGWKLDVATPQSATTITLKYSGTTPVQAYPITVHNLGSANDASSTFSVATGSAQQVSISSNNSNLTAAGTAAWFDPIQNTTASFSGNLNLSLPRGDSVTYTLTFKNTGDMPLVTPATYWDFIQGATNITDANARGHVLVAAMSSTCKNKTVLNVNESCTISASINAPANAPTTSKIMWRTYNGSFYLYLQGR